MFEEQAVADTDGGEDAADRKSGLAAAIRGGSLLLLGGAGLLALDVRLHVDRLGEVGRYALGIAALFLLACFCGWIARSDLAQATPTLVFVPFGILGFVLVWEVSPRIVGLVATVLGIDLVSKVIANVISSSSSDESLLRHNRDYADAQRLRDRAFVRR